MATGLRQREHPATALVGTKTLALVEVLGAGVVGVDLEVEGAAAVGAGHLDHRLEELLAQATATLARDDVELVEPAGVTTVLHRPDEREVGYTQRRTVGLVV